MKKTIIASAIAAAVAAPAAFADVSLSGQINQEFYKQDGGDLSSDLNSDLVFSGSEDLGNGMKASFKMTFNLDDGAIGGDQADASRGSVAIASASTTTTIDADSAHTGSTTSTQTITLSGDFGAITVGREETLTESMVAAMAANDAADSLSNEVAGNNGTVNNASATYMSPNMNGFQLGLQGQGTTAGDDLDVTTVMVSYTNGPLTVKASSEDNAGTDTTVVAGSYTIDGLTVSAVMSDSDASAGEETWVGAKYTMGANTIAISRNSADTRANDDTLISLSHSMSKQTSAYIAWEDDSAAAAADDKKTVLLGVKHSF